MAYRGFSGGGFVGNHLTTALLEALRPAADNAGRHATVGSPDTTAAPYVSDGESWKAVVLLSADGTALVSGDGVLPFSWCLGAQHTAVTAPADTAENTLYSLTIPAGTMGLNDTLRISTLSTVTNSGNNKTLRVAFGGSNVSTFVVTTSAAVKTQHQLSNRNSLSSQIMGGATSGLSYGPSGVSALAVGTLSVDTSAAQTLTVTGQKATGAEVFTLESVVVELIRGPA